MVSEDSPSPSNSSILHQFIIANQTQFGNQHYDSYGTDSITNNNPYTNPHFLSERMPRSVDIIHNHVPELSDISKERRLMNLLGTSNERLSLSLGSDPSSQRAVLNSNLFNPCNYVINDYSFPGTTFMNQSCSTSYGTENATGSSKYLKPAQSLLEEMVSVGSKDIDISNQKYVEKLSHGSKKGYFGLSSELKAEFSNSNSELLGEKHGTYVNLLRLLALLEEVERRYEQYYNHMEELISSFESIAGLGAGKSYTALALQAMSKHFCSLRTAILSQIRVTKLKIGKDMPKLSSRLSQLSLLDQEARQRVSLQQLGIMQNSRQTWRPIRGLPETSVTVLRAWLFEHFLHPYPNDYEKLMLASQTGLSKNQVSNWFINARVRLWKPMIEEMYKEEFAESSTESDQLLTSSSTTREGVGDSAEDFN